ncbi:MAG TPA: TonB C-terminal domain-containing protein, partial [Gemmatimonadaceae bacterium]|nr:TonB C-terminal domain-containing protein [Gemmatimonadaceae bacterium]
MRPTLPIAIGLLSLCASLPAQENVVAPGGATTAMPRARQCEKKKLEMVDLRAVGPGAVELPGEYRKRVATEVFFYFNPPEFRQPRFSVQKLVIHSNGAISNVKLVESSQNDYFDREAKRAIDEAARAGAFLPFPHGVSGDSLPLELSFGRRAGETKSYRETRTSCPAWPKRGNPRPDYPRDMREHSVQGIVRARFMVGIDGRVKPNTLTILQATNQQFAR